MVMKSSPMPAPSPDLSPTPAIPVSEAEKKSLTSEFKKLLSSEEKAFSRREKTEGKQFASNQKAKQKTWYEQEKKARHVFFDQHLSGPERRQYIQDYLKRKEAFDQSIKDEAAKNKVDWQQRREAMKRSQQDRELKVKHSLDQNLKPDEALWKSAY